MSPMENPSLGMGSVFPSPFHMARNRGRGQTHPQVPRSFLGTRPQWGLGSVARGKMRGPPGGREAFRVQGEESRTLGTWPDISRVRHVAPREACGLAPGCACGPRVLT